MTSVPHLGIRAPSTKPTAPMPAPQADQGQAAQPSPSGGYSPWRVCVAPMLDWTVS